MDIPSCERTDSVVSVSDVNNMDSQTVYSHSAVPQSSASEVVSKNEDGDLSCAENDSDTSKICSKRQLKRLKKFQDRFKMRAEWKLQRKLKNKTRKTKNKSNLLGLEKPKITPMSNSTRKFTVVIDFSYDKLMSAKDLIKCGNQVIRCYASNRRSSNPMQLHFCNFGGKIEAELSKNNGYGKWDIHFHESNYLDVFNKSDLVYLTSESRNVLETLEESKVYIIGGLVDHNAHKGVSYQKAVHEGIAHAQLPIKKYMLMKSRSVLTINHVFDILLKVANGESWDKALLSAVPPRFFETIISENETSDSVKISHVEENTDSKIKVAEDLKTETMNSSKINEKPITVTDIATTE